MARAWPAGFADRFVSMAAFVLRHSHAAAPWDRRTPDLLGSPETEHDLFKLRRQATAQINDVTSHCLPIFRRCGAVELHDALPKHFCSPFSLCPAPPSLSSTNPNANSHSRLDSARVLLVLLATNEWRKLRQRKLPCLLHLYAHFH